MKTSYEARTHTNLEVRVNWYDTRAYKNEFIGAEKTPKNAPKIANMKTTFVFCHFLTLILR